MLVYNVSSNNMVEISTGWLDVCLVLFMKQRLSFC